MLVEKKLDLPSSNVEWLRLDQVIPFELVDSLYWLLKNLGIDRFSLEQDPNNRFTQKLFIWLPMSEWTEIDQEDLVESIISLAKPFKLTLPKPKWDQVKDEDWSLNWKKNWRPDSIGKSILILPVWLDIPMDIQSAMIEVESLSGYVSEEEEETFENFEQKLDKLRNVEKKDLYDAIEKNSPFK